jgi:Fuc2NAc and GlcNAc transferase
MIVLLAVVVAILSWLGTAGVRRYALAHHLMDHPNERSSHTAPTPRGGGAAIAGAMFVGLLVGYGCGWLGGAQLLGYLGAGTMVALLGFLDDHGHVAARWRLLGHFIAASWLMYWLGGLPVLELGGGRWDLGVWGWPLGVVGLVWLLNLYNFMDGIDGLAGSQAVSVCGVACVIYLIGGHPSLLLVPLCMAGAALGFLRWNWPPARIFMGDVGSGFVGLMIGGMALQASHEVPDYLWVWAILMAVFICDATWTLLRRLLRGKRVYEAHRSHGYQHAAQRWGSHRKVVSGVLGINLVWLPLCVCIGWSALGTGWPMVLAAAPILAMARYLGAGTDR